VIKRVERGLGCSSVVELYLACKRSWVQSSAPKRKKLGEKIKKRIRLKRK
jgi:hypothetical protein